MYTVYQPNNITEEEILEFVKASKNSIEENETKSSIPTLARKFPKSIEERLVKKFSEDTKLLYKQTKNGEAIYLRRAANDPILMEDGYLILEYGLINFYEGSKSFIYEQEFWDAWHDYVKSQDYMGWGTILAESETTEAYKRVINMGLLGEDVHYAPLKFDGIAVPGFKKIKVTF